MKLVCPICKKVVDDAAADYPSRPFCSARCRLADLDNWLNERYRISTSVAPGEGDEGDLRRDLN